MLRQLPQKDVGYHAKGTGVGDESEALATIDAEVAAAACAEAKFVFNIEYYKFLANYPGSSLQQQKELVVQYTSMFIRMQRIVGDSAGKAEIYFHFMQNIRATAKPSDPGISAFLGDLRMQSVACKAVDAIFACRDEMSGWHKELLTLKAAICDVFAVSVADDRVAAHEVPTLHAQLVAPAKDTASVSRRIGKLLQYHFAACIESLGTVTASSLDVLFDLENLLQLRTKLKAALLHIAEWHVDNVSGYLQNIKPMREKIERFTALIEHLCKAIHFYQINVVLPKHKLKLYEFIHDNFCMHDLANNAKYKSLRLSVKWLCEKQLAYLHKLKLMPECIGDSGSAVIIRGLVAERIENLNAIVTALDRNEHTPRLLLDVASFERAIAPAKRLLRLRRMNLNLCHGRSDATVAAARAEIAARIEKLVAVDQAQGVDVFYCLTIMQGIKFLNRGKEMCDSTNGFFADPYFAAAQDAFAMPNP